MKMPTGLFTFHSATTCSPSGLALARVVGGTGVGTAGAAIAIGDELARGELAGCELHAKAAAPAISAIALSMAPVGR
jgi:hypothetical protein